MSDQQSARNGRGVLGMPAGSSRAVSPRKVGSLYQTSTISALADGVYVGEATYGDLHRHGDFGLGTFNNLDGEMVGLDGVFYQLRSDGSVRIVQDDWNTPFAAVTFFEASTSVQLQSTSKAEVFDRLMQSIEVNLFTAIRIDGRFKRVVTRTVHEQRPPFPKFPDAASKEKKSMLADVEGTLAGYRTPIYAGNLNVPGFHLHFLSADRAVGGHVLDFEIDEAIAKLCPLHSLHVDFPRSGAFLKANLDSPDLARDISAAENS
ncbi:MULTISPECIES: acetolactate decarboxylase [Rhizobium]|nr:MULTISPECIES: acetolactate decarboxylase [Rhizobium]